MIGKRSAHHSLHSPVGSFSAQRGERRGGREGGRGKVERKRGRERSNEACSVRDVKRMMSESENEGTQRQNLIFKGGLNLNVGGDDWTRARQNSSSSRQMRSKMKRHGVGE